MIQKLEVDGYRLLDGFQADLRQLTVVIGANAVGKSTLLDCLQFISQCAEYPLNTSIGWHWGLASLLNASASGKTLGWKLTIEKPKGASWAHFPLEEGHPLVYEVVLKGDPTGQVIAQYEVLRKPEPGPGHVEPYKLLEATLYKRSILDRKQHRFIPFGEAIPRPHSSSSLESSSGPSAQGTTTAPGTTPGQESALVLSQVRFFDDFPAPSAIRYLLAMMAFYPGFDVNRGSILRTKAAEIRPTPVLQPNGENLGSVLHEILTRYDFRPAAEDVRGFLRAAYPSFEEIHCDTTFGTPPQVLVRLREKGMSRSSELWELSDGMLRFLCLATALMNPISAPLVAIDEPELGLHPRLLPIIGDMIKTAAESKQVLVTTHSPDLLNQFGLDDVAVMARPGDEPKATWVRPGDRKTLVQMLKAVTSETLADLHRSGELEAIG